MATQEQNTILLVEDEAIIAIAEARTIKQFGYKVITVNSGEKAITLAMEEKTIDLILMDIDLGKGISGPEAAAQILKNRSIPIVFLTSHSEREMVEKVRGVTRYGYMIKDSGDFVLQSSIEMAFELFEAHQILKNELSERKRTENALKKSEERYRSLYNNTPVMLHSIDAHGNLISVSDYWLSTLGYTQKEVLGRKSSDFLTEASRKYASEIILPEFWRTGYCNNVEYQYVKKNGEVIDALLSAISERDENGKPVRSLAVITNITEHKRSVEQLAKLTECFLQFGADPLVNINLLVEVCGKLMGATCALYNRLQAGMLCSLGQWNTPPGYQSTDQPAGHICYDVIKADGDKTVVIRNLQESSYVKSDPNVQLYALKTYVGKAVKFRGTSVGSLCVVFQSDVIPTDIDMHLMEIVASAIGVEEERKHGEESRQQSEEKYRTYVNESPEGIFIVDAEGNYQDVNATACSMLGYTREEFLSLSIRDLNSKNDPGVTSSRFQKLKETGQIRAEIFLTKKDGDLLPVSMNAIQLSNGTYMAFCTDITERNRNAALLREKTEELERYFTSSLDLLCIADTEGYFHRLNPEWEKTLGYSLEDLEGKRFLDFVHPEDMAATLAAISQLDAQEAVLNFENRYRCKDGSYRWIEWRSMPVGKLIYAAAHDITERKRTEEELANERTLLRNIIDNLPDPIYVKDLQGRKTVANLAEAHWSGRETVEDVLGKTDAELYSADVAAHSKREEEEIFKTGKPIINNEDKFVSNDGKEHWSVGAKIPFKDAKGIPAGILGITHDITGRKRVEETLRENEEKFRAAFENAPMGMSMVRPDGQFLAVNSVFCQMLGYSKEEILAGTLNTVTHPDDIERGAQWIRKMISGDRSEPEFEKRYIHKDGHIVWCLIRAEWIKDNAGSAKLSVVHILDITERKRVEDALRESEEWNKLILSTVLSGLIVIDADTRKIVQINETALKLIGLTNEQVVGNVCHHFICPASEKNCPILDRGKKVDFSERVLLTADGSQKEIIKTVSPVHLRGRNYLIESFVDITERKHVESEIQLLAQTLASTKDCVSITDLDDKIIFVNDAFLQTYRYAQVELVGQPISILRSPNTSQEIANQIQAGTLAGGWYGEILNRRKDGNDFSVELWTSVVKDNRGKVVATVGVAREITERKRMEAEREQLVSELQEALANIKTLGGLIPICASCKKIRDDQGFWNQLEKYIIDHSEARFSHGICPDCAKKLYPELYENEES
jgi:PAS domain S-box-containing protein